MSELCADRRNVFRDVKMHVTRLAKGELLRSHAVFGQPVKIQFPLPARVQRR